MANPPNLHVVEETPRSASDFVELFVASTDGIPSPQLFREWTAISVLGACMERRCSIRLNSRMPDLYPNFYIVLTAGPAVGKTAAIDRARHLLRAVEPPNKIHIAPKGVTKAAMIDCIAKAKRMPGIAEGNPLDEYHSLFCGAGEFGVLVPAHDLEFLNVLNDIFDNPDLFDDETRTSKKVSITKPQVSILAGTQPAYLGSMFPEEAWGMGFMSRILMIYAATGPRMEMDFPESALDADPNEAFPFYKEMAQYLNDLAKLRGRFKWTKAAQQEFIGWYTTGMQPVPSHSRLSHYLGRRQINAAKLCMIASVAHRLDLVIDREDVQRAIQWLVQAEKKMPDVFREMSAKSDAVVIQELYHYMWEVFLAENKRPLHENRLYRFLSNRVPSEKISKIIEIATRSGIIAQAETGFYIPRPRDGKELS